MGRHRPADGVAHAGIAGTANLVINNVLDAMLRIPGGGGPKPRATDSRRLAAQGA